LLEAGQPLSPLAKLGIDLFDKPPGLFLQFLHGFLQGVDRFGRHSDGSGLNEQVLLVVFEEQVKHLEVVPTEEPRKRAGTEVGAVLVEDVPEGLNVKNAYNTGHLHEDEGLRILDRYPNGLHEAVRIVNMLQRMPTGNAIGLKLTVLFRIELLDEANAGHLFAASGHIGGIDADASVVARLAEQPKIIALAATDLDDLLVPNPVFIDKPVRYAGEKLHEGRGKSLLVFIALGEVVDRCVEFAVEDKAARVAKGENDILARNRQCLVAVLDGDQALGRGVWNGEKGLEVRAPATGAFSVFHGGPLCSAGGWGLRAEG